MNYQEICRLTREVAQEAGAFIRSEVEGMKTRTVEVKGLHNFVTEVDKGSEALIVKRLEAILPEAGFIAEEGTSVRRGDRYNWVIDPLDGTTNFIHGLPPYSVSLALMEGAEVVVGVVYEITLDECFYAWKGSDAFMNDVKIRVSVRPTVDDSLIATGFPYYDYHLMRPYIACLEYFLEHSHGVRRLGSAAADLAYVACGRFDAFYEYSLNPWDVAAGSLIVERAGGKMCDFSGGNDYIFGKELVASSAAISEEFLNVVKSFMKS